MVRTQAVTDVPHLLFVEELVPVYPDMKVVLNTRDPDSSSKSYCNAVAWIISSGGPLRAWIQMGGARAEFRGPHVRRHVRQEEVRRVLRQSKGDSAHGTAAGA
ncbi:hypothetical protein C8J57DRAFT_1507406 [Mycena rebaudengoi]|nr:hypothetical protein C8J57DRAFT_1514627 [Mycena rebaudengoi]KAJ7271498.1 hypothetical protein C8J57DRAFT_1507406 [Mycena rebaudengoi]